MAARPQLRGLSVKISVAGLPTSDRVALTLALALAVLCLLVVAATNGGAGPSSDDPAPSGLPQVAPRPAARA